MIIRYYGHSFLGVELSDGRVITFDPYGKFYHYPDRKIPCQLCLVSHHHSDHDGVECVDGKPVILDSPGFYRPMPGVRVRGIETDHDERGGALRGKNTFFVVEAEELTIAHAGDLGHIPTKVQLSEIGHPDILFLPIGGYYTIGAEKAEQVRKLIQPRVLIPIHYQTEMNPEMNIAPLSRYLQLVKVETNPMPLMRVTEADISERKEIEVLSVLP